MMTDDRQPRTQWSGETMTAPMTSREELLGLLEKHVDGVRHYLHLQIGKPLSKDLISAPEIALDNLRRELAEAITVPAQRPVNPITDAMVEAGARELWNDRDARMGGTWDSRDPREVCVIQTKATMRAALSAALSTIPSTGLPAPAPHAEVREALEHLGNALYFVADVHPDDRNEALDSALAFYNEQMPRCKVEPSGHGFQRLIDPALALPQSTEHRCRNCGDPHTEIKEVFCGTCREMGCSGK